MELIDTASERIKRIRYRLLDDIPIISIERAKFYTEKWIQTENQEISLGERVALCMKHVLENITIFIDSDDRIVGTSWEFRLI